MPSLDQVRDSIYAAGQQVSMRARNASENARIKNQIKNNEKEIDRLTGEVGKQCVDAHLQDEDTEYEEIFAEIRRLKDENQDYQRELDELNAVKICPQCGTANKVTSRFCINCGSPLPDEQEQSASSEGKKQCPNCGAVNDSDAAFCVECGAVLPEVSPEETPETEPEPDFSDAGPEYEPESEPEMEPEPEPTIDLSAVDEEYLDEDELDFETEEMEPVPDDEDELDFETEEMEPIPDDEEEEDEELGPVEEEEPLAGIRCPNCGTINDDDSLFCVECGTPLTDAEPEEYDDSIYYCKNCGAPMTEDMIFCTNCGTRRE